MNLMPKQRGAALGMLIGFASALVALISLGSRLDTVYLQQGLPEIAI